MSKWEPTHVQVTVHRGSSLLIKGKNGTNDCFVTIALGSTKFQTSVKEKADRNVEWHEECELPIPDRGNTAEIVLTALHRNFLGLDEFLGRCAIPLNQFDVYNKARSKWYKLRSKPGREKEKERGDLEVKVAFIVKSGSRADLSEKKKKGIGSSLTSLTGKGKRISVSKIASSMGINRIGKDKHKDFEFEEGSSLGSVNSLKRRTICVEPSRGGFVGKQHFARSDQSENADPGVDTDEDDFTLDALSHNSSGSSINVISGRGDAANNGSAVNTIGVSPEIGRRHTHAVSTPPKPPRNENRPAATILSSPSEKWFGISQKNQMKTSSSSANLTTNVVSGRIEEEDVHFSDVAVTDNNNQQYNQVNNKLSSPKQKNLLSHVTESGGKPERHSVLRAIFGKDKTEERIIIGGENESPVSVHKYISNELLQKYEGKSREELILQVCNMQSELEHNRKKLKDLEDYLDNLLLRVMETTPRILQNPYVHCKLAHKQLTEFH